MPKLPTKKPVKGTHEDENEEVITAEPGQQEDPNEDANQEGQDTALENLMNAAAETVNSGADPEETKENEETSEEGHNEGSDEEDEPDAGENPETAPPKEDEDTITVSKPKSVPTKETTVQVATVTDHDCFIGGKAYHFKKGVPTSVPKPVKDILRRAGILMPL